MTCAVPASGRESIGGGVPSQGKEGAVNPYAKFLGHRDPLVAAAATPAKIVALIRGLTPRQLTQRPAP